MMVNDTLRSNINRTVNIYHVFHEIVQYSSCRSGEKPVTRVIIDKSNMPMQLETKGKRPERSVRFLEPCYSLHSIFFPTEIF